MMATLELGTNVTSEDGRGVKELLTRGGLGALTMVGGLSPSLLSANAAHATVPDNYPDHYATAPNEGTSATSPSTASESATYDMNIVAAKDHLAAPIVYLVSRAGNQQEIDQMAAFVTGISGNTALSGIFNTAALTAPTNANIVSLPAAQPAPVIKESNPVPVPSVPTTEAQKITDRLQNPFSFIGPPPASSIPSSSIPSSAPDKVAAPVSTAPEPTQTETIVPHDGSALGLAVAISDETHTPLATNEAWILEHNREVRSDNPVVLPISPNVLPAVIAADPAAESAVGNNIAAIPSLHGVAAATEHAHILELEADGVVPNTAVAIEEDLNQESDNKPVDPGDFVNGKPTANGEAQLRGDRGHIKTPEFPNGMPSDPAGQLAYIVKVDIPREGAALENDLHDNNIPLSKLETDILNWERPGIPGPRNELEKEAIDAAHTPPATISTPAATSAPAAPITLPKAQPIQPKPIFTPVPSLPPSYSSIEHSPTTTSEPPASAPVNFGAVQAATSIAVPPPQPVQTPPIPTAVQPVAAASTIPAIVWPFATKGPAQFNRVDEGWDLQTTPGAAVLAIANGTVIESPQKDWGGFDTDRPVLITDRKPAGALSNTFNYGHTHILQGLSGKHVVAGQIIGTTNVTNGLDNGGATQAGSNAPEGYLELDEDIPGTGIPLQHGSPTRAGENVKAILINAPAVPVQG